MAEIFKPERVALILGVSSQCLREHMKRGLWDLGEVIPAKTRGGKLMEYNIFRAKLEKKIGRKLTEEELAMLTQRK